MTPREQDQQAALQAALEDLARVQSERDAMQDEIRCVRLRAQSAEGLARMAEQRQSRLEMELQASRAGHRTTQGCYEAELAARKAVEQERDELALTLEAPLQGVHPAIVLAAIQWWGIDKAGAVAEARIAAHDRAVAARVLREAEGYVVKPIDCSTLLRLADQYERGEREVPGE